MTLLLVGTVAFLASALTFISGFGLGTLLMPVFALFMPLERAIAATGVVHFLNSLFKFALVGRRADWPIVARFGLPALVASLLGAWWLVHVSAQPPLFSWSLGTRVLQVTTARVLIGALLLVFVLVEWVPRWKALTFPPSLIPLGGVLSGLAGGVSGMQGALRSAFLARAGLSRDAFIATGVAIACLIDVSRLGVYARGFRAHRQAIDETLLLVAIAAAFAGALVGRRYLERLTMEAVRHVIAVLLLLVAVAMAIGLI
ncbi:hypothetical protein TBR22_A07860 [Luteitalea sp. TBR-22]|uniref:sulfite exporter TauE/SafE family protein n=1 Tax=Luteitalea sp. TBR-22 TaxID=2802971 RepID=UPI001AF8159F|nr:sulfite exporter TauE/SafE family protein [Luteitalea sp. TBR-22]BCS31584.1 hypothetical protein TBR22_A07860 [Luteitalea sp. TBR-22]